MINYTREFSEYYSAYTMQGQDGSIEVYQDELYFRITEPSGTNTSILGRGLVGDDRQVMYLFMRPEAGKLVGTWQECDADSGIVSYGGPIEFVAGEDDGRYYGYWKTRDNEHAVDTGTWVLSPKVGAAALAGNETLVQNI